MGIFVLAVLTLAPTAALAQQGQGGGSGNGGAVRVTGILGTLLGDGTVQPAAGAVVRNAQIQIDHFSVVQDATTGANQLLASGTVSGVATVNGQTTRFVQAFTDVPARLLGGAAADGITTQQATTCPILDLDIGPIHLDLLGLVIDLAPVNLDIVAERGPGNLLGNLLCAIVGLFD